MRVTVIEAILCGLLALATQPVPAEADDTLGDYLDSPVFYELYASRYITPGDLEILREGRLRIHHYPSISTKNFDWMGAEDDEFTWWIQVEELRFLLPLIASDERPDRELAREWIRGWLDVHEANEDPNPGAWQEPMTVAYRGMVLVYFVKREALAGNPDPALLERVWIAISDHVDYLREPGNFNATSNHGIVEAFGMIELTRVLENTYDRTLGLERLLLLANHSVTAQGFHREHSPHYHFTVARWLDEFVAYLETLDDVPVAILEALEVRRERMLDASWFLLRHDGDLPQIGDTDSTNVAEVYPQLGRLPAPDGPMAFDPDAGYSIYKGIRRSDRRYVVFANQRERPRMIYHFHDDVLSVYFADDAETILGDAGKYEYAWTPTRAYFKGPFAHNRIFRAADLSRRRGNLEVGIADSTWAVLDGDGARMGARTNVMLVEVTREVEIPRRGGLLQVRDRLRRVGKASRGTKMHLAMTWNAGRDVVSFARVETGDKREIEYRLTTRRGRRFRLRVTVEGEGGVGYRTAAGETDPMLGWYSPRHHVKRPSPTALITLTPDPELTVTTVLERITDPVPFLSGLTILMRGY